MGEFKASAAGMAASALHAAGSFFGGILDRLLPAVMRSSAPSRARRMMRPSVRPRKRPSPTSNSVLNARGGCVRRRAGTSNARCAYECAPDIETELAAAQVQTTVEQMKTKLQEQD